jgi:hypothetical protein
MSNQDDGNNNKKPPTYKIGYGKPPKHTRFKPGQSGNPKGRKKRDKTIRSILQKISAEMVTAKLPEGERRMTALEFVLLSLRNRAAKGDSRATAKYIDLTLAAFGIGEPDNNKQDISEEDRQLLLAALQSLGNKSNGA